MQITIDTTEPLTETDKQILTALTGGVVVATAPKAATPAPAKKAAAAPAAKEPVVEAEPEPDEDLLGGDEVTVTKDDVKALATAMVADGKAAKVKAALTAVGAKKISDVTDDKVAQVHTLLTAE